MLHSLRFRLLFVLMVTVVIVALLTVRATAIGARACAAQVTISVRDTGVGIPAEYFPYIFERFFRADLSRTRATGGAGLGLTIVKQLVEAHDGAIWAESTPGIGSVFTFTLPTAR